ncbi:hypothetical protein AKJ51_02640 [candidate division MSBL1 archaeon SCGC-AAA382A20]|uniref:Uncharacterized protein n=1 Tax=candidate division MSBL1 archaeon SCGC-AAA382A20 TaxID=1698280 RepID=A0A133VK95_9EURY|nr:hypothetical protein AKJ51_02640 [candidate division MSBL1 archaeon SCGC-AAA382A20]
MKIRIFSGVCKMKRDPFEEMEEKMKKMMEEGISGGGRSITVKQTGEGTTVDVSGDISDEEVERLEEKYPDADIRVEGKSIEKEKGPVIEVIDEEENEEE